MDLIKNKRYATFVVVLFYGFEEIGKFHFITYWIAAFYISESHYKIHFTREAELLSHRQGFVTQD